MDKYIIYGTGKVAKEHYERIVNEYGSECIECFIDSMLVKQEFCGKNVIKPNELKGLEVNNYKYLLGTLTNKDSMIGELMRQGVSYKNIIIERDYGSNSFEKNVKEIRRILIYPEITQENLIGELDNQIKALVPNIIDLGSKPKVISKTNKDFEYIDVLYPGGSEVLSEYDLVLVWDKEYLGEEELKNIKNVYCIDPTFFYGINVRIFLRINLILEDEYKKKEYMQYSNDIYREYDKRYLGSRSYVIATGPSCKDGVNVEFEENSIRIVCNDFVSKTEYVQKVKPNVYVMADEFFMVEGCKETIKRVCEYVDNNECILVLPEVLAAVVVTRFPQIAKKIVRVNFNTDKINFPSIGNMAVYRKAYNIITTLAIPIASHFSNEIYISGCDGIDLKEHIFDKNLWKHDEKIEQERKFDFGRYAQEEKWEEDYYMKHIAYFSELLDFGEKEGKRYISYTNSYIPALSSRKI